MTDKTAESPRVFWGAYERLSTAIDDLLADRRYWVERAEVAEAKLAQCPAQGDMNACHAIDVSLGEADMAARHATLTIDNLLERVKDDEARVAALERAIKEYAACETCARGHECEPNECGLKNGYLCWEFNQARFAEGEMENESL